MNTITEIRRTIFFMYSKGSTLTDIRREIKSKKWTNLTIAIELALSEMTVCKKDDWYIIVPSKINF